MHKGFTLIEVMVVVVIIGILATFLVPKIMDAPDKARVEKAKAEMRGIATALQLYKFDNGFYPTSEQGLQALVTEASTDPVPLYFKSGGYLNELPKDPWGVYYIYMYPGEGNKDFDIISFGADRKEGGSGYDADIKY